MTGAQSAKVYDLWIASGKPERLGYAAAGGYVDAGVRWVAADGMSCAGGALGLRMSGGRLLGRWCGGVASGAPLVDASASFYAESRVVGMYGVHSFKNPFSVACHVTCQVGPLSDVFDFADMSGWGSLAKNGERVGFSPGSQMGEGTYYFDLPASASFTVRAFMRDVWAWAPVQQFSVNVTFSPSVRNLPATPDAAISAVVAVDVEAAGVPWVTARAWSEAGSWVRRKSWLDSLMMIRHEAGPGTVRAVAMFKSASVTTARAVRNAEFGQAEFAACDWALKYPPQQTEVDLTDAVIAVDALAWQLWKGSPGVDAAADSAGGSGAAAVSSAAGVALPKSGEGFVYLRNGETTLVAAIDFDSDTPWSP